MKMIRVTSTDLSVENTAIPNFMYQTAIWSTYAGYPNPVLGPIMTSENNFLFNGQSSFVGSALVAQNLEVKDSVSSNVAKPRYKLVPKKSKINLKSYLAKPVKPLYNPPIFRPRRRKTPKALYSWKAPIRKVHYSDKLYLSICESSFARYRNHSNLVALQQLIALNSFEVSEQKRRSRYEKRLSAYRSQFKLRMDKYERRLRIYEKRLLIVKAWSEKPRLALSSRQRNYNTENPFSFTKMIGNFRYTPLSTHVAAFFVYGGSAYCTADCPSPLHGHYQAILSAYANSTLPDDPSSDIKAAVDNYISAIDVGLSEEISELDNACLRKQHTKIGNGDLHVGNIIAERAQTLSMLNDLMKRFANLATGKKKLISSVSHFVRNPRLIADDFLAFMFGVKPLLDDAYALGKTIALWSSEDEAVFAFRSNSKTFVSKTFVSHGTQYTYSGLIEISYVSKYRVASDAARHLSQLGLVNPAEIAWEVMPWSFVVDWFLPVQKYLESTHSLTGLTFVSCTRKIRLLGTIATDGAMAGPSSVPMVYSGGLPVGVVDFSGSILSKRRTVLTSTPLPTYIALKSNPFSLTHLAEGLALIVQRLFR